jgi:hypothetical protein
VEGFCGAPRLMLVRHLPKFRLLSAGLPAVLCKGLFEPLLIECGSAGAAAHVKIIPSRIVLRVSGEHVAKT